MQWGAGKIAHLRMPGCNDFVSASDPGGICISFTSQWRCAVRTGGRYEERDVPTGCVGVTGPEPVYWLRVLEPAELVEIAGTLDLRQSIAAELGIPQHADLDDLHGGTDPVVWAVGARFRAGLRGRADISDLERDQLLRALYRTIFESRFGGRISVRRNGALDPRRLARVTDYIEANLADEITSADLSRVAALSTFHFLRSFRLATGMTPHLYLRGRRLEWARASVGGGMAPDAAGAAMGFSHPRHFRAAYRRHHGFSVDDTKRFAAFS